MTRVLIDTEWPVAIPLPFVDVSGAPDRAIIASSVESAKIQRRLRYASSQVAMSVSWVLNVGAYTAFKAFFLTDLDNGAKLFIIELRYPENTALTEWVVRFDGGYEAEFQDGQWVVNAQLDLLYPALLPEAAGSIYDEESWVTDESSGAEPDVPIVPDLVYSGCKDEITILIPDLPGMVNVAVLHSDSVEGPWEFWTETRASAGQIVLGNYFAGRWLRVDAGFGDRWVAIARFQPDPPNVLPPVLTVQQHDNGDTNYTDPASSAYAAPYPGVIGDGSAAPVWVVSSSTKVDPQTGVKMYGLPLFSNAFVEIRKHYLYEYGAGGSYEGIDLLFEVSTAQVGATCKLTVNGSDPSLTNGYTSRDLQGTSNATDGYGLPYGVAIARAFKDGCQSPPVYIMVDTRKIQLSRLEAVINNNIGTWGCGEQTYSNNYIDPAHPEDGCEVVNRGQFGDLGICTPYVLGDATANAITTSVAGGMTAGSTNGLTLATWSAGETATYTEPWYFGPPTAACPSDRYGGGLHSGTASRQELSGYNYNWDTSLANYSSEVMAFSGSKLHLTGEDEVSGAIDTIVDLTTQGELALISDILGPNGGDVNRMNLYFKPRPFAYGGVLPFLGPGVWAISWPYYAGFRTVVLTEAWIIVSAAKLNTT